MSNAITRQKVNQAIGLLQATDIDVWLTFARETSQTPDPALDLILGHGVTWDSAFILARTGEKIAIVGRYEADNVRNTGAYDEVQTYDLGIADLLRQTLTRLGPKKIGLNYSLSGSEADGLTHGNFLRLTAMLHELNVDFVSAEDIIRRIREQKSADELALIAAITKTQERVYAEMFKLPLRGMSEVEIQTRSHAIIADHGCEPDGGANANPIVNAGPDSSIGHGMPNPNLTVQPGQILHFDMWLRDKQGYCADLQRCAYVLRAGETEAPDLVRRAWDACWIALEAGRAVLKPGVQAFETDLAAREALQECGYPEYMHALGHHIGRKTHDGGSVLGPRWERYGDRPFKQIEAGNVFTLELGTIVDGYGYIGLEEMVVVTDNGTAWLSTPQRHIALI